MISAEAAADRVKQIISKAAIDLASAPIVGVRRSTETNLYLAATAVL
ncbi:hypothetical protein [Bradyrhizobium sp. HKCCYLR20261]